MQKRKIRYGTLTLGLLVALSIALSSLFSNNFQAPTLKVKKDKQEQNSTDHSDETQATLSISSSSLPAASQVVNSVDIVLLFEVLFHDVLFERTEESTCLSFNAALCNLLGAIISPNAP